MKYLCKLNLSTHDKSHSAQYGWSHNWAAHWPSQNKPKGISFYLRNSQIISHTVNFRKINKTNNNWLTLFIALFIAAVRLRVIINILLALKTIKRFSLVSIRNFLEKTFLIKQCLLLCKRSPQKRIYGHHDSGWRGFLLHDASQPCESSWKLASRGAPGVWPHHPWRHEPVTRPSWHLSWTAHQLSARPRCHPNKT